MSRNEEIEARREELREVFRAGYEAGHREGVVGHHDPEDAFNAWLDKQFAEVDPWAGGAGGPVPLQDLDDEPDPTPCCPDPDCPGRFGTLPCTFPGYADNH
jgi:hypothetical protein